MSDQDRSERDAYRRLAARGIPAARASIAAALARTGVDVETADHAPRVERR